MRVSCWKREGVRDVERRCVFFFQAEDGIRDLVRSRGLGDVYKRQVSTRLFLRMTQYAIRAKGTNMNMVTQNAPQPVYTCLLYTSDAADERSSVDLGGRRIIQKKKIDVYRRYD